MQILRNVAFFMFVNVFFHHFGSNFVCFERRMRHLRGILGNLYRERRKMWGEMRETHELFLRGVWAERLENGLCNFVKISTCRKPENTRHIF